MYLDLVFDIPLQQRYTYAMDDKGEAAVGKRVMAPFGRREMLGYVIGRRENLPDGVAVEAIKKIRRVVDKEPIFGTNEIDLALWMASYYLCGTGEALATMVPSGRRETSSEASLDEEVQITEKALDLSEEQQEALERIVAGSAIMKSGPPMFYLYGITGSGKTEVFLRTAEAMLQAGKSVIYLVPEIALTHQVEEAVQRRFGSVATTIHSGMTGSARLTEWGRIRRGEVRIVVGPRSAVFAPVQDLGLLIIDEEHDGSYKSGNTPRYHARQVAFKRCAMQGATLVMGSATPSAEAWRLMENGTIRRLSLSKRLSGGAPPNIKIIDLAGTEGCLSEELKEEIRETARMGRQTILFLNRRGFSYFYHCRQCGYELTCRHCSVSLTYHKQLGKAVCHYCGFSAPPPRVCPQCGSLEAGFAGFGTEMIEEEVRRTFPDLRIRRADADSTAKKGSLRETLEVFRAGGIDILLGTQMVAKGLNFPGVRLVGVVLADTALNLPDFRSAERTFALIVQVAGRAGRYFPDGKVLVQTFRPQDPAITYACNADIEGFYRQELAQRKELGFPPYTRLIRMTARSKQEALAERTIRRLAALLKERLPSNCDVLGPADCPISLMAGNYRKQLILRGSAMSGIHEAVQKALAIYEAKKTNGVYVEVDVDPVQLL
ncbi:replication restart helicase PriA [Gracilinema caldarium]|uniref:Replication restart protein PriA n=1 Tax=Gracilinema caldarium (strain ATCC 51460 / DSM 7334 / H1) TaxID=744872 RepID=F8EZA6_GRAC1|nr:primosomal protein N' [Gracilinema caldarium]AEJ19698.1 primosomal protein N' [Gracilinema caldarium DSM 7334]